MSRRSSFMSLALTGRIQNPTEAIDDYIEEWHVARTNLELHEWLGLTWEEYTLFVEKPEFLSILLDRIERERRYAG